MPEVDFFANLGLERLADLSSDAVRAAFQERGRGAHPDAGGTDEQFGAINKAHATLLDPALRLRHLAELEFAAAPDSAGEVSAATMQLFELVGGAIAKADAFLRRRGEASSAIARALLAADEAQVQAGVMRAGGAVRKRRDEVLAQLPEIDAEIAAGSGRAEGLLGDCYRELAFIAKWEAEISERMASLI